MVIYTCAPVQLFGGLNPELYRGTRDPGELDFPDGHLGRIWFGLDYDAPTERLLVKIIKCRNLPSRTLGQISCCDPFIRVYLMPDERRYLQTKFNKKTCNPVFDETYVFQLPLYVARHMDERVLKLCVVDNERGKHHKAIGHALFSLSQLDWACGENTLVTWKDLDKHATQIESSGGRQGELHVGLTYHANQERLTVALMETRAMPENLTHTQLGRIILGSFMFARGRALQHWIETITNAPKQMREWHCFM
ncbi:synaptotagmin-15-like [Varroa destructor]|uniref:C2 domain-containing protein n=1 Tax=Varroa destructor TaxID=109461 RepID=A0A7M7MAZ4_VARDE|nr:synaptotagmin-15-like [Varroa destructor]